MPLPTPLAVANLLTDLVGRDVTAKTATAAPLAAPKHLVAEYRDADGALKALTCCNLALGGSFAAALTVIPVSQVDDGVKQGALVDGLAENAHEVFNVLSAIFPKAGMPRLILRGVHADGKLDADVAALLAKPAQRLDMDVSVAGYRSGKLTIAV